MLQNKKKYTKPMILVHNEEHLLLFISRDPSWSFKGDSDPLSAPPREVREASGDPSRAALEQDRKPLTGLPSPPTETWHWLIPFLPKGVKNHLPSHISDYSPHSQSWPNIHFINLKVKPALDIRSVTWMILAQVLGKVKSNCVRCPPAMLRAQKPVSGNVPRVLPYSTPAHLIQVVFDLQHLPLMLKDLHSLLTTLFLLAKAKKRTSNAKNLFTHTRPGSCVSQILPTSNFLGKAIHLPL